MSDAPYFFTWSRQRDARPMQIVGGHGAWFDTADGQRWLDLGALVYQANLGHGHPRMLEALEKQVGELCLTMPTAVYPAKEQLAEELLALAPPGFSKVFFALGGAEAVENALKIARLVTGRHKTISRYRSYHGATMGALSLTGDWRRPPLEPGLPGAIHALDCYCDRCPFGKEVATCARECATNVAAQLELEGAKSVAAVFLESVPGANGVLVPPPDYWTIVRDACDKHGALLVADEVLCGFGRTGRWFGYEHFDVVPDMITLGKGLTGGYGVLSAVLVHERVAEHFDEGFLYAGLTNYAHPLGCAAGLEAVRIYRDEKLVERAASLEQPMLEGLARIVKAHDNVLFSRGLGLLGAVELDWPEPDPRWASLKVELRRRCVHVHVRPRNGTIIVSPPLCIPESDLLAGIGHLGEAIDIAEET